MCLVVVVFVASFVVVLSVVVVEVVVVVVVVVAAVVVATARLFVFVCLFYCFTAGVPRRLHFCTVSLLVLIASYHAEIENGTVNSYVLPHILALITWLHYGRLAFDHDC